MRKIQLKEAEKKEAKKIIEKYGKYSDELNGITERLHKLNEEKEKILSEIDKNKEKEDVFFENLRSNYGSGKLDLLTFQYIIED